MCCFYPGNVICLNALRSPGARPAAVIVFLRLCCQSGPGYLWESKPAGSSRPHPGTWPGLLRFIGPIPLRFTETVCGEGQHCLGPSKQRWLGSILTGRQRKGKSGVERASDLAAAVWSRFYKKCSHRKYLRFVMCKQDWRWWEHSSVRTDIKQHSVALTLFGECFHAWGIIKKPRKGRKEVMTDWTI